MRQSGSYFELTDRVVPGKSLDGGTSGAMVISVPKRVLPSAVRRNTVKRIVRESWRAALAGHPDGEGAPIATGTCLVRLKRYPGTRSGLAAPPGFSGIKRQLRADADHVFAAFLKGRAGPIRIT